MAGTILHTESKLVRSAGRPSRPALVESAGTGRGDLGRRIGAAPCGFSAARSALFKERTAPGDKGDDDAATQGRTRFAARGTEVGGGR